LIEVGLLESPTAYCVLAAAALIDFYLLYWFFKKRASRDPELELAAGFPGH
jgi:hypothetical protein